MDMLNNLIGVLQEEVQVGENLLHNLLAQRNAILAWDAHTLLERLSEKELLVYRLASVVEQQRELMARIIDSPSDQRAVLSELLRRLPVGAEHDAISTLQDQAYALYSRVQAEERHLAGVLENLLGHMRTILAPLAEAPVYVYSKSGSTSASRATSGLIQGKA
jgi:hypothetical protein